MHYKIVQNEAPPYDWLVIDANGTVISSGSASLAEAMAEVHRLQLRDSNQEYEGRQETMRALEEEADQARKAQDEEANKLRKQLNDEDDPRPYFDP